MNFALAAAVLGLIRSAWSVSPTRPPLADGEVDVASLQDATRNVRGIRLALTQAFYSRFPIAEGGKEREGKLRRIERSIRKRRYRLFDLYRIHFIEPASLVY